MLGFGAAYIRDLTVSFSANFSQQACHSSPIKVRYWMSFVIWNFDLCTASITLVLYTIYVSWQSLTDIKGTTVIFFSAKLLSWKLIQAWRQCLSLKIMEAWLKWWPFLKTQFSVVFHDWNPWHIHWNSLWGSHFQLINIGLGNEKKKKNLEINF